MDHRTITRMHARIIADAERSERGRQARIIGLLTTALLIIVTALYIIIN